MRNPFKKHNPDGYTEVELDDLIDSVLSSIVVLISDIEQLKQEIEDLTDFVEDRLD